MLKDVAEAQQGVLMELRQRFRRSRDWLKRRVISVHTFFLNEKGAKMHAVGSGWLLCMDGDPFVVTNSHVLRYFARIADPEKKELVVFTGKPDGESFAFEAVYRQRPDNAAEPDGDQYSNRDIAVLQLPGQALTP